MRSSWARASDANSEKNAAKLLFIAQRQRENLSDVVNEMDFEFLADFGRDFKPVVAIALGQNDLFEASAGGSEDFFFDTANAKNAAAQADFASHANVGTDEAVGQQGGERGDDGDTSAGPVLGRGARGDMHVDIALVVICHVYF